MRFKSIFWLFNIVVVLALVIFTISSFFLFGREYAAVYWGNMWMILVLFVVLIGVLDVFFIRNWKLFDLLEKEDWPGLMGWLEDRIYTRGRVNRIYTGLYLNTILSTGRLETLVRLENEIREKKPAMFPRFGVSMGIDRLRKGGSPEILSYFTPLAEDPKTVGRDWARWCRAMASGDDGTEELVRLMESPDMSVRILAADLLDGRGDERIPEGLRRLQADLAGSAGDKAIQRSREDNLIAVVLCANVREARERIQSRTID